MSKWYNYRVFGKPSDNEKCFISFIYDKVQAKDLIYSYLKILDLISGDGI